MIEAAERMLKWRVDDNASRIPLQTGEGLVEAILGRIKAALHQLRGAKH